MEQPNTDIELTPEEMEAEKAKIRDNVENPNKDNEDDVPLPSEGEKKYAGVYENLDELKKGITNLKADVPDYMLNGMSDEALEQYYTDLRKEFSGKAPEPKAEEPTPEPEDKSNEPKVDKPDVISDDLWKELDQEFMANGGLSDEYYDKLSKLGIPSQVVDKYIDGLANDAKIFTSNVYDLAGGEENYNNIKAWAEENYPQAQLDMIAQGSHEDILFKMKAVKADYDSKVGVSNDRMVGNSNQSTNKGYVSQADYLRDVMSPEYKKNSKYRAKVDAKFASSSFGS